MSLEELSELSLRAAEAAVITSQCSFFAETGGGSPLNRRTPAANVAAGLNLSICRRIFGLARRSGLRERVTPTGGAARSACLLDALATTLEVDLLPLKADPQAMGAVGAAVLARQRIREGRTAGVAAGGTRFGSGRRSLFSTTSNSGG